MQFLAQGRLADVARGLVELGVDLVEFRAVLLQVGPARVGDGVKPLAARRRRDDEVGLLQHLQQGIDGAGARAVGAREAVLQGLDDVVAVAGLVGDQAQHDETQGPGVKHAAPAAAERSAMVPAERATASASALAPERPFPLVAPRHGGGREAKTAEMIEHGNLRS